MYISESKDRVIQVLRMFLQHDQGNHVTIFNIAGLIGRIEMVFKECEQKPDKKDKKKRRNNE